MRIAICDDERACLTQASSLLEAWAKSRTNLIIECFTEGDSLIRAQKSTRPFDIILLDIIMPALNGIEVAREIRSFDKDVKLVFLTSSAEYAIESYSVKASNYLLKPIAPEALFACLGELESEIDAANEKRTVLVRGSRTVHRLDPRSIECLEARGKHVVLTLTTGESIGSIETLHALENKLDIADGFFKCHRSYIVNINHVGAYTTDEITMRSGSRVPIARNIKAEFKNAYFSIIFGADGDGL